MLCFPVCFEQDCRKREEMNALQQAKNHLDGLATAIKYIFGYQAFEHVTWEQVQAQAGSVVPPYVLTENDRIAYQIYRNSLPAQGS